MVRLDWGGRKGRRGTVGGWLWGHTDLVNPILHFLSSVTLHNLLILSDSVFICKGDNKVTELMGSLRRLDEIVYVPHSAGITDPFMPVFRA